MDSLLLVIVFGYKRYNSVEKGGSWLGGGGRELLYKIVCCDSIKLLKGALKVRHSLSCSGLASLGKWPVRV